MEEVKAMVDTETDDYFRLQSMDSGLQDLVNSSANKQIFNQLKFSEDAYYDKKLNTLGTMKFTNHNQYQRQPYVANGYIGSRIPNLGQGFAYDSLPDFEASGDANDLYNGWPLFTRRFAGAFIAGFYDLQENTTGTNFPELLENGYESVIAAVPQWTTLKVQMYRDGKKYTLDSSLGHSDVGNISNYMQNLSLSSGIVTTQYTWLDEIDIKFTVLAHKSELSLGLVTLDVHNRANKTVLLTIIDEIDFNTAKRCELNVVGYDSTGIHMTFQPKNVDYVHGAIYSSLLIGDGNIERQSTDRVVNQTAKLQVGANDNVQLRKVVGIISSDLDPETLSTASDVREAAKQIVQKNKDDPRMLIKSHIDAWAETLGTSERISFPSEPLLDLGAKASMFHLLANTRSNAQGLTGAVGVSGLSSDSYGGMVFWDTDLWMFNGILPFVPSHAKSIVNYRLHTHEQALKNVPKGYGGAVYPWTSGRFGNCTATGPCLDYEYHINSAIAMAAWELYLSGAVDDDYLRNVAFPLINDAATFYTEYLVKYNDTFNKFTTHNLTDPDEYANHVDNGAYTNSGISLVMQWAIAVANHLGEQVPQIFYQIASDIYIPTADNSQNITLEYSGMNSSVGIKQADVVMMTYPLENNLIDDEQGYLNMEFYSMKQVSYGPAMTYPIFSVVAAKLAATGCASQSYLHKALQPYLRGPFAQFSEQNNDDYNINGGTHPAFPFLTGHGGFLQAALLGLTGMRHKFTIDKDNKISRILHLDPIALPCLGEGVRYDSIHYDNHTISMNINQTHFTIKNNGKTFPKARDYIQLALSERNPAHGSYQLKDEEERAFPLTVLKKSFVDSISECGDATFYNITEGAFGVAAISMNDGDNTTRWQAKSNDMTGKVMVDLHSIKNVSAVEFNWADRPPQFLKISKYTGSKFTNITDFLAKVDFGNRVYENYRFANPEDKLYNQSEIFEVVHSEIVNISEPYSEDEIREIMVPLRHNTTSLDLNIDSQFILIEVKGIHDDIPHDEEVGGAKLAEVVFY
ncbi:ATH1 [Candida oxycetoniae]|uniref:alpha,alpha-trehalase n=1 Tax=Candida oxycetoniae TaxID=497107 RepID=A0AAI9T021_9ASCO|nr:ATH1 [Candida oxycetoniae]KAI3405879.2 ATH1 [Candida oxycetoniae]